MSEKRHIEVFSAGCPLCREVEEMVRSLDCDNCRITVRHMNDPADATRAKELGVATVPAVAIDGQLAACCSSQGPKAEIIKAACQG